MPATKWTFNNKSSSDLTFIHKTGGACTGVLGNVCVLEPAGLHKHIAKAKHSASLISDKNHEDNPSPIAEEEQVNKNITITTRCYVPLSLFAPRLNSFSSKVLPVSREKYIFLYCSKLKMRAKLFLCKVKQVRATQDTGSLHWSAASQFQQWADLQTDRLSYSQAI